jgi:hypothetical protein
MTPSIASDLLTVWLPFPYLDEIMLRFLCAVSGSCCTGFCACPNGMVMRQVDW